MGRAVGQTLVSSSTLQAPSSVNFGNPSQPLLHLKHLVALKGEVSRIDTFAILVQGAFTTESED